MARNRKRMALYEVIGPKRSNIASKVEPLRPAKSPNLEAEKDDSPAEEPIKWPKKPRMWQLNAGRIEISMPYPLAIAIALGVLLLSAFCYRLGQFSSLKEQTPELADSTVTNVAEMPAQSLPVINRVAETPAQPVMRNSEPENANVSAVSKGTNVIVIASLQDSRTLEPVKEYFSKYGIATEVMFDNGWYFLITKQKFDSDPKMQGTEGNAVLKKIIELGAGYKSPQGYTPLRPNPFSDAYGMKLN